MILKARASFATCALLLGAAAAADAQIVLEDRRLEGAVGFTNTVLAPPGLQVPEEILARSIGADPAFNNLGVVVEDPAAPPTRRAHEVVVQAFGGDYWLTTLVRLENGQRYRFGHAQHEDGPPGFPNFLNEAWRPLTQPVTEAHPAVIEDVDLLECAGLVRVHFIEEDPGVPGGYRPATRAITSVRIGAFPREDPLALAPPYAYQSGFISSINGGPQAESALLAGPEAELWLRSSEQADGGSPAPPVGYRVRVDWRQSCSELNPDCPEVPPGARSRSALFEGATDTLGSFSGGVPSVGGLLPGIEIGCDESLDLYVVVEPCPVPPCEDDGGGGDESPSLTGCVNLVGEEELFLEGRTLVRGGGATDEDISNGGETAFPWSELFSDFDPAQSEGLYLLEDLAAAPGSSVPLRTEIRLHEHDDLPDQGLTLFSSAPVNALVPDRGELAAGPDFCMVPGAYVGTLRLLDGGAGGSVGALQDLRPAGSFHSARSGRGGSVLRYFGDVTCDPVAGDCRVAVETVFANPERLRDTWTHDIQHHEFENLSPEPALFVRGKSQLVFQRPRRSVDWDPLDFIGPAAGGRWTGELEPGTEIAARPFREVPADLELCYSTLRVQVLSSDALFFEPRITTYRGSYLDDAGTADPTDDLAYTVVPARPWEGSPRTIDEAASEGFVVLHLPAGEYRDLSGFITTVLGEGLTGTTQLPTLDIDLDCGASCTARPNAVVCLSPLEACNDPDVLDDDRVTVRGVLSHDEPIVSGTWRINDGPENPIDLDEAGIDCGPAPCSDLFAVDVEGFSACRNDVEIRFVDAAGEPISAFLTTVVDSSPPTFHEPGRPEEPYDCGSVRRRVIPCGSNESVSEPVPVAADDCSSEDDPDSPLTVTENWPDKFLLGTTVASVEAVDACGNVATCEITVIVTEQSGEPECPAPLVLDCEGPDGLAREHPRIRAWLDEARGACGGELENDAPERFPVGCGPEDATVVTFTSTDPDDPSSCESSVLVIDREPPALSVPEPLLLECDSPGGVPLAHPAIQDWLREASGEDACSAVSLGHDAPAFFPSGCAPGETTTVSFTAVDACGLATTRSSTVTVVDTSPPTLEVPEPLVLECSSPGGVPVEDPAIQAWLSEAAGLDACGGVSIVHDAPARFPSGCAPGESTTVTFTATDDCGNAASLSSTITVVDTTAPSLRVPGPLTLECSSEGGVPLEDPAVQAWLAEASATDLCGEAVVAHDAPSLFPSGCRPGATTTVTFTATDECGNAVAESSTVTVVDTTAPSLVAPPPIVLECVSPEGVPADDPRILAWLAAASATDLCGEVELTHDAPGAFPGGCPPGETTPVTFTATDECGNAVSAVSTVTVVDTTPPVIEVQPRLGDPCLVLWPPQHGYVTVSLEDTGIVASDLCGEVRLEFARCRSSQPEDAEGAANAGGGGDGETDCDCATSPDGRLAALRAERNGGCAPLGRTYTLWIDAVDECGNRVRSEPIVACVPHDNGSGRAPRPGRAGRRGTHPREDLCLEGWTNGLYPEPAAPDEPPVCGAGCEEACAPGGGR